MEKQKKKISPTKVNYLVDIAIFIAFLLAMEPRLTNITIHEWLSLAFAATIIVHLLLHWQWLVATTRRFLRKVARQARLNYILNTLFFIDMTLIIFTGIMISEVALPQLGIRFASSFIWRRLHSMTADAGVIILGLHVALHWKWILNTTKRYVVKPILSLRLGTARKEAQA